MQKQTSSPKHKTSRQVTQVVIDAPIRKVWDALTRENEVLPFFFGSVMHTPRFEPGKPVRMRSPNGKYTAVVGDILEVNPPYRFAMTFRFTNLNDAVCKVIHELKDLGGRTEYTLIAEDVPAGTKTEKNMAGGAKFITSALKHWVETGKPTGMARFIMVMSKLFAFANPKASRSENWPMDKKTPME
jgi:uncharacterized protein YndB with AHSA1/START domain